MHTGEQILSILDTPSLNSWRTFLLKCMITVLVWSSQCEAQCSVPPSGFLASTEPQFVYSLNYPKAYPDGVSCSWRINSPIDTGRIQLRVVRDDFSCCCNEDYLLIKDGANSSARPIAKLCSASNPVTITSSGPSLYGEFRSDDAGEGSENTRLGYTLQFDYFDSEVSCPSGWIERNDTCYKLYNDSMPWQQAASRCGYDGGFLTSIVDQEENDFLVDSFQGQSSLSWIGMNSTGKWLDGSNSQFYNNFSDESPSSSQCFAINLENSGRWIVSNCIKRHLTFICKKTQDGSGGRYWTEIAVIGGKLSATIITLLVVLSIFILSILYIVCCRCSCNKDDWLITELLTCLCQYFERTQQPDESNRTRRESSSSNTAELPHRVSDFPISRSSSSSESDDRSRRASATSHPSPTCDDATSEPPPAHTAELRLDRVSSDDVRMSRSSSSLENVDRSRRESVTSQPSPTCCDATSEPPPTSYTEALDPTFDISTGDTETMENVV